MPALEQQYSSDHVSNPTVKSSSGLKDVQRETWGPEAASSQKTQPSNALDAFGHVTIAMSSQGDWLRDWCAKPFKEFQPLAGLKIAEKDLEQSKSSLNDHVLGIEVGTVKAVYAVGSGVIGLGNMLVSPPARLGNWLANTIKDPTTASNDSAKFGDDVGKTIVTGRTVLDAAGNYVEQVKQSQAKGDYSKPLVDADHELHVLTDKFKKLNPAQRTEAVSEQVLNMGIQVVTGKILAAAPEAFASLMEKMDAFKIKADAYRVHFGIEEKLPAPEKIQPPHETKDAIKSSHHQNEEQHLAGGRNSRFNYEEIDKFRSLDVPIQCHKNACVAAVGEMLSARKIDQHWLVQSMELNLLPGDRGKEALLSLKYLEKELGSDWKFETVSLERKIDPEPLLADLLSRKHPFGVTLKAFGLDAHAVVVDGINEAGRLVIKDPGDGTMYQMKMGDFLEYWTGQAVAKKVH